MTEPSNDHQNEITKSQPGPDENENINALKKGDCIIPWAVLDTFVWTAAGLTCGICNIL
jgi:hypothetical protein